MLGSVIFRTGLAIFSLRAFVMGSSGTGNFTDYPGTGGGRPGGGGGGAGGGGGGEKSDERCGNALEGVSLQEVATCGYFKAHGTLPAKRSRVHIRKKLLSGRVVVDLSATDEAIGLLPTKYNYVVACMKNGWEYTGNVVDNTSGKIPKVIVDLVAKK